MKTILATAAACLVVIIFAWGMACADVTLDTPVPNPPTVGDGIKYKLINIHASIPGKTFVVVWDLVDASDNKINTITCSIQNIPASCSVPASDQADCGAKGGVWTAAASHWNDIIGQNVIAGDVGKNASAVFLKVVQDKCKTLLGVSGTTN